ncbi:hypothetical protein DFH11DRAFT_1545988 [Phellopilus nigrolimitatus]|nr:hypothetical protein DFH11DRAFT_1545988 [Phellopilus nigrolimitatus]
MLPTVPRLAQAASVPFKRSQNGLFHGKLIQFGNNVPFSKHKTRRTWLPNIQNKGLKSDILDRGFRLKVSTKALKTIKKLGGLDQYILNTRHELLGQEGMRIRIMLRDKQDAQANQAALDAERAPLERAAREGVKAEQSSGSNIRHQLGAGPMVKAARRGPAVRMLKLERKEAGQEAGEVRTRTRAPAKGKESVLPQKANAKAGAMKSS